MPLGSLWAREHQGSGRAGLIPPPQPRTLDTSLRTGHGVSSWGLAGHGQAGAQLHRKRLPRAGVSAGRSLPAALQQDGVAPGRTGAPVLAAGPQEGHAPRALAQGTCYSRQTLLLRTSTATHISIATFCQSSCSLLTLLSLQKSPSWKNLCIPEILADPDGDLKAIFQY